jgi:NAD(P)-dependent dehydrogenase (short-subunit alcohol dehydrogenase family)
MIDIDPLLGVPEPNPLLMEHITWPEIEIDPKHAEAHWMRGTILLAQNKKSEGERELMRRQCLKRKLYPDDMARIVLFLAADDSGAMTNQTYVCDGGWV